MTITLENRPCHGDFPIFCDCLVHIELVGETRRKSWRFNTRGFIHGSMLLVISMWFYLLVRIFSVKLVHCIVKENQTLSLGYFSENVHIYMYHA